MLIAVLAGVTAVAALRSHWNDFWPYYWAATHALSDPLRMYGPIPADAFGHDVPPFVYPPTAILLLLPFAAVSPGTAGWIMFAVSVASAAATVLVLLPRVVTSNAIGPLATTLLMVSGVLNYPFYATLINGQVNIVVGVLLLAFVMFHQRSQSFWSAVCLALAIGLKLFPGIFLVPLMVRRRWRDVALVLSILAVMVALTIGLLGVEPWGEWVARVVAPGSFGPLPALAADLFAYNVSINGTVIRMFGAGALAATAALTSALLLIVLSIRAMLKRSQTPAREAAMTGLVMFCAAPISWVHHLAMVIPLVIAAFGTQKSLRLGAIAYAAMCFKWDWPWGPMTIGGVAPPTIAAIALWSDLLKKLPEQHVERP